MKWLNLKKEDVEDNLLEFPYDDSGRIHEILIDIIGEVERDTYSKDYMLAEFLIERELVWVERDIIMSDDCISYHLVEDENFKLSIKWKNKFTYYVKLLNEVLVSFDEIYYGLHN